MPRRFTDERLFLWSVGFPLWGYCRTPTCRNTFMKKGIPTVHRRCCFEKRMVRSPCILQTPGAASLEKAEQPFSRFGKSQVGGCLGGFRGPFALISPSRA